MMMYVTFFLTILLLIQFLFSLKKEKSAKVKRRLSMITDKEAAAARALEDEEKKELNVIQRAMRSIWLRMKRRFERKSGMRDTGIELKLLQAGNPFGMGTFEYRLMQIMMMIAMPIIGVIYSLLIKPDISGMLLGGLFGFLIGTVLPSYYLSAKTRQRSKKGLRELPDILDLLTVSLEAGLGFDSALHKLVLKSEGVVSGEFHRCLEEIRLGKTRREALLGVRDRLVIEEVRVLISSILQAEKLGIGMVQVLRVQSQEVREQRKQRAEEAAMKAPIKMLFPLILFIFPSLFIVLLGPAVIQFMTTFK
ncbi:MULTISPECIES: type II secretion system F family protein [unclassified Paenibacillus]|uniref:type II secretion system F family protein n=1 Tax=unclassified Paenibacillus TaxID=185978 RepID=UPI002786E86D|nr:MULTISPECIES: type II secretion system F family protein [unclassified Paenibacillus]MDQ0902274.1 tight adherence protein C [Paenibacillus sp. V4I7]MDQ0919230.1 tight adherence protein C [Paenibacillus sp. V4I5]